MNPNKQLIAVVIVTYNRLNSLKKVLIKLSEQDYQNLEIFVLDNGSDDPITSENLDVKLNVHILREDKNIGIAAFNKVIPKINSDFFLILDDDSYPEIGAIEKATDYLITDEECGIVAFNIFNSKFELYETRSYTPGYVNMFVGCGAMFRSNAIKHLEFYDELFFIYENEIDLSIRILDSGYKIYYMPEGSVIHYSDKIKKNESSETLLKDPKRFSYVYSNYLFFLIKHFDMKWVFIYGLKWILNRLIVSIRFLYLIPHMKGLIRFVHLLPRVLGKRSKVSHEIQKLYQFGKIPLIDREFFPDFKKPISLKHNQNAKN